MTYLHETEENPKMFQVYLNQAWHEVFCYAFAVEKAKKRVEEETLLFTIVSGSDSALQSIRGAIDCGTRGGLKFGYGTNQLTSYRFTQEKSVGAEKGKYENYPEFLFSRKPLKTLDMYGFLTVFYCDLLKWKVRLPLNL